MDYITELDFTNLESIKKINNLIPVSLFIDNTYFEMKKAPWKEFLKIFYYCAFKNEDVNKFIKDHKDKPMLSLKKIIFSEYESTFDNDGVKISSDIFVRFFDKNLALNIDALKRVANTSADFDFRVFFASKNDINKDKFKKEKEVLKTKILKTKSKKKVITKNVGHYIAHINGKILTEYEKFIYDFKKKFKKATLLGDIVLNDNQEELLQQYMKYEIERISKNYDSIANEELFCYGLVRFAMKWYGTKFTNFWPYLKKEYGFKLTAAQQTRINNIFEETMKRNNKKYYQSDEDSKGSKKIDNISMHCFVTDNFANQFFDYLFDFWRIDLERNVENLSNENGQDNIDTLIYEITKGNLESENNKIGIKRHTAMAVDSNTKGSKLRLRNLLNIIDDCFWNGIKEISSNNRIYKLLEVWMRDEKGLFQGENKAYSHKNGYKKEHLLSKPVIAFASSSELKLILPREVILNYKLYDDVYWNITIGSKVVKVKPQILEGKIRFYALQTDVLLEDEDIFEKITCELYDENNKYASFTIRNDDYRFISLNKRFVENYEKGISEGDYYVFSKQEIVPTLLDKEVNPIKSGDFYATFYKLEDGDVLIFPNELAIQVGQTIEPGLFGVKNVDGVYALINDEKVKVYSSLPRVMFKAEEHQLKGTSITINGKLYNITNFNLRKLKVADEVDNVFAYLLDLKELNLRDGFYNIFIKVPNNRSINNYNFVYINKFTYRFLNAPYVFNELGTIEFSNVFNILCDDFENVFTVNRYSFNFDPLNQEIDERVIDDKIRFEYQFRDQIIDLYFDIPALYWKYKSDANWNVKAPNDISRKKIPNNLYLKGGFDFKKSFIKLNIENFYQDTRIECEKESNDGVYRFRLEKIQSWIEEKNDVDYLNIDLVTPGKTIPFTRLICRSIVKGSQIYGDYERKVIYGTFDIEGDSEYSVAIKYNGEKIQEDIPVIDGEFKFEYDFEEGMYEVYLFEIIEDDSGFIDSYTIPLKKYHLKLINQDNLSRYTVKLLSIKDRRGFYKPLELSVDYRIINLVKVDYTIADKIDLFKLCDLDVSNEDDMKKLKFYKGTLIRQLGSNQHLIFNVLMIFYDKYNITKYYLLGYSEKDDLYLEILYYRSNKQLLIDEPIDNINNKNMKKKVIRKYLDTLFLEDYVFESRMEE